MKWLFLATALIIQNAAAKESARSTAQSFNHAIATAVSNVEEVRSKESELRTSQIIRRQSQFQFLPNLQLTATQSRIGTEFSSLENGDTKKSYGLRSDLNLFRFGGDWALYRSADFNESSLRFDLEHTRLKMENVLASKAFELIASRQESLIRKKLIAAQRSFFSVAEKRYQRGILSKQELDQVTIDLRIAEARLKDAAMIEFKNREALRVYFNSSRSELELPPEISDSWPWLEKLKVTSPRKVQFDVENHPSWKQSQTRVEATSYATKNKLSSLLPSLDLSVLYDNVEGPEPSFRWASQWTGLVTLTVPLFSRFQGFGAYQLSKEEEVRDRLILDRTTREVRAQWTTAQVEFEVQLASALTREQTLKISHTLYSDNLRRFQAGRTNANDLFNDQDRLYQAELLLVQGWRAAHEAYLKLCHSAGQSIAECTF